MNYQKLYSSKPTEDKFDDRCLKIAELEAEVINYILDEYGIRAYVNPKTSLITPQFFAFNIDLMPGKNGKVSSVIGLHHEIAIAISNLRGEETVMRIQELPLMIEIPNPWPRPISCLEADWKLKPDQMIAGRSYDPYKGKTQLLIDFDANQPHVGVFGASGAGKSVELRVMLLGLAGNTSPEDLELYLCDLKGQDLPAFHGLPHVRGIARTVEQAERIVSHVYAEMMRRTTSSPPHGKRLVLVVDEQAELREHTSIVQMENSILALGRDLRVNVIISSQHPTEKEMGALSTKNLSVRLVGNVANASAAQYATGRAKSGAQFLPRGGSFLFIDGSVMKRFQGYLIESDQVSNYIKMVKRQWSHITINQLSPVNVTPKHDENGQKPPKSGITGEITDKNNQFPIGGRPLTDAEKGYVRELSERAEYQWRGSLSRSALCKKVYGSKNDDRMNWISEAFDNEPSRVIHLPNRMAK